MAIDMTSRTRPRRSLGIVLTLTLGGLVALAGPSACKRRAPAQAPGGGTTAYAAVQPLHAYQQDPTWQHRLAVVTVGTGNTVTREPSRSLFEARQSTAAGDGLAAASQVQGAASAGAPPLDLAGQLEEAGFTVARLDTAPQDPGDYNTVIEVSRYVTQQSSQPLRLEMQTVARARVLAPAGEGVYEGNPVEIDASAGTLSGAEQAAYGGQLRDAERELYGRIVAGLVQVLGPTPKPVEVVEEPPPPDPREVCRAECTSRQASCARQCCEKELGSDPAVCDAARAAAAACNQGCVDRAQSEADEGARERKLADCQDGCRRGKHSAYPSDPKIARNASVHAKCDLACEREQESCLAGCDAGGATPAEPGATP
jgi:hypothetical protein